MGMYPYDYIEILDEKGYSKEDILKQLNEYFDKKESEEKNE